MVGISTLKNKLLLDTAISLGDVKNRFESAQKTGSCVNMKPREDWQA